MILCCARLLDEQLACDNVLIENAPVQHLCSAFLSLSLDFSMVSPGLAKLKVIPVEHRFIRV